MTNSILSIDNNLIIVDNSFVSPPELVLQNKTVVPNETQQIIKSDIEYDALSQVTVNAIQTEQKVVTPSNTQQVIVPTSGKYLSQVTVNAIYAVIGVTYPEGNICACEKTDKTISFIAPNTSGMAVFNIPYAGAWTVMSYDGADYDSSENKVSEIVEITSEGQSKNVKLNYKTMLFNRGSIVSWTAQSSRPTATIGSTLYVVAQASFFDVRSEITTTDKIDVSNYSTLNFNVTSVVGNRAYVGISSATQGVSANGGTTSSVIASVNTTSVGLYSIDISEVSGQYYIFLGTGGRNQSVLEVDKVWLE